MDEQRIRTKRRFKLVPELILGTMLRRRAYTVAQFAQLLADSPFRGADIRNDGIGVAIRADKRAVERAA